MHPDDYEGPSPFDGHKFTCAYRSSMGGLNCDCEEQSTSAPLPHSFHKKECDDEEGDCSCGGPYYDWGTSIVTVVEWNAAVGNHHCCMDCSFRDTEGDYDWSSHIHNPPGTGGRWGVELEDGFTLIELMFSLLLIFLLTAIGPWQGTAFMMIIGAWLIVRPERKK